MKTELKQKWLDALRSGKYKQGKGLLRDRNDCFCCLGVLCDVAGMRWIPGATEDYAPAGQSIYMPTPKQREELGLSFEVAAHFSKRNDNGNTFRDIAHEIETLIPEDEENAEDDEMYWGYHGDEEDVS